MNAYSIKEYIKGNEALSAHFLKLSCDEMKNTMESIVDMSQHSVFSRTAKMLLRLQSLFKIQTGESFPIRISRDDLAGWVGTRTETISRSLNEFKREGLISLKSGSISIINIEGLEKVVTLW
jgi:CRP-like cAMP-binding protein